MKNKIITNDGYAQFIWGDGSGRIHETACDNVYAAFYEDTVSFVLIGLPKSSGLALFTTRAEDLELNGVTYSVAELPDAVAEAFAPGGVGIHFEIVDELPEVGEGNVIYLVPSAESGASDSYTEYIWLESEERYEKIGTTDGAELNVPIWKDRNPGTLKFNHSGNKATGVRASAFGYETVASGTDSLVMGDRCSGTSNGTFAQGYFTQATAPHAVALGDKAIASGQDSFAQGMDTKATNNVEFSVGRHNVSHKVSNDFGNSGNTLFSIGNGSTSGTAHNALEVMQNGDIYLTLDGQDVKLQDHLASEPSSAVTSGDTNAVQGGAVYDVIESNEKVIANALNDIQENKQDKLIAGENITISGNVISAEGGESYSAGVGIDIDSANTITAVYDGYLSYDNPQQTINNYEGEVYILAPFDCEGMSTGMCDIYTAEISDDYKYTFSFNPTAKQYSVESYPVGKENDWTDYFTLEFDDWFGGFKMTTLQQVSYLTDNLCTRFFRIGSEYTDYSFKYSGTTKDALDGIIENFKNYVYDGALGVNNKEITLYMYKKNNMVLNTIPLVDLVADNGKLRTDINVGTGVSGWTEYDISSNQCSVGYGNALGFTTFRISGDTNELNSWGLQIAVGWENDYNWDFVQWDDNESTFIRTTQRDEDIFSAATVNWDSQNGILTIAYPTSVIVNGESKQTELYNVNSNNCTYGIFITKFEYYGEIKQPIVPYVQGKIDTSAIVTSISSSSTDAEVPSAKAVNDQMGGLKLMSISQAVYDALVTKDPNTLYIIND